MVDHAWYVTLILNRLAWQYAYNKQVSALILDVYLSVKPAISAAGSAPATVPTTTSLAA